MEKIWVKKELYKWIYEFLNFIVFSVFYFDFSALNRAIGRSGLNRAIGRSGLNRAIGRSGLNRAIGRSRLNRAIGRLKSHGVESASWATIPPITRDLTAEITRSEIRVTSHQFRAIRRLKSHGVKSASWATIHQFRTNLSINRPHLQCKIHLLVGLLLEVGHWDQGC